MNRRFKKGAAMARAIAVMGVVGAACLTRPVETWDPNLKTVVTNVIHQQAVDKLDLLFMIDNSASMGDKQALLAQAVPDMITRLVSPNCVDLAGKVYGPSDMNGQCTMGKPEFPAVHDMHIGIITSSLGGRGGNQCNPADTNQANPGVNAHNDDQAHLINRGGDAMETPVAKATATGNNFLAWFPPATNKGATAPPGAEIVVGASGTPDTLIGDFTSMITGVHEHGCGFEAQNEAWYRFLVQPDPFDSIPINNNRASLAGLDTIILQQRKAFLRPDSLLTIIVVTDENEEVANPLSIGGEGYLYESAPFPSSPSYGAPEGTSECKSGGPNDPNCTSCAFQNIQGLPPATFSQRCPNDPPNGVQGFLDPTNDAVNVRFFNQKQRFGVFAGYPISRYVRGLTSAAVPDRANEVDKNSGDYIDQPATLCVNPIFAQDLPTDPKADLCHLTRGPRTPDLVYYAAIAGVPHQLLQAQAGIDMECPAGTPQADCPQKSQYTDTDWLAMTGRDPDHYDFSGADFHMLESIAPRQSQCGQMATDTCDPINGREWNTNKQDLQFACIFQLVDAQTGMPKPKDCTDAQFKGACDCDVGVNAANTQLCQKGANGMYTTTQINGKAYPSVREVAIAHAMAIANPNSIQGIVSSLCPIHTSYAGGNTSDPLYGYRPAVSAIVNRLKSALSVQCLPQRLTQDSQGNVQCLVLVSLPKVGAKCSLDVGLTDPPPDVAARYRAAQKAAWKPESGLPNPDTLTLCKLTQLIPSTPGAFGPDNTCTASTVPGWCYVEGQAAGTCPQQILFTRNEPPVGSTVNLQCIEQARNALDGGS